MEEKSMILRYLLTVSVGIAFALIPLTPLLSVNAPDTAAQMSKNSVKDDQLAQAVKDALGSKDALKPYLSDIKIEALDGSITLTGKVPNAQVKAYARLVTQHVSGVKFVINSITVEKKSDLPK